MKVYKRLTFGRWLLTSVWVLLFVGQVACMINVDFDFKSKGECEDYINECKLKDRKLEWYIQILSKNLREQVERIKKLEKSSNNKELNKLKRELITIQHVFRHDESLLQSDINKLKRDLKRERRDKIKWKKLFNKEKKKFALLKKSSDLFLIKSEKANKKLREQVKIAEEWEERFIDIQQVSSRRLRELKKLKKTDPILRIEELERELKLSRKSIKLKRMFVVAYKDLTKNIKNLTKLDDDRGCDGMACECCCSKKNKAKKMRQANENCKKELLLLWNKIDKELKKYLKQ